MVSSISKFFLFPKIARSLLWIGLFLGSLASLQADLDSNSTPKLKKKSTPTGSSLPNAIAETANAEVSRAGEITLRLRGIARGGGQVEFKLQQKPLHGRIIRSKPSGLDTLEVLYRHSGDQSSDTDSFIFAVRAGGSGPFSPGVAKIRVIDQPGRLLAPEAMSFPATLVGKTAIDSFVVVNEGGETLQGKITITPPWHLKETSAYYLNPGEKRKITLLFAPTNNGPVDGRLIFEGKKPISVELLGEGIGTFLASPAKLKLVPTLDSQRKGIIAVQNNTDGAMTIEIQSPLNLPKSVTLQFGETQEITVEDDGIGQLNTAVIFTNGAYSARVDVSADEAAPRLPVATPAATPSETPTPPTAVASAPISPVSPTAEPTPDKVATPKSSTPLEYISAKIVRLSRKSIRLDWTFPKSGPAATYSIQQRYLLLDQEKKLTPEWVEVPSAQIALGEKTGSAKIDDLDADTVFTFRVLQTSGDTSPRPSSLPLTYQTQPGFFRSLTWRSYLVFLGIVLVGLVIGKRWRERTH